MRGAPRKVSKSSFDFFVVFRTFVEDAVLRRFTEHPDRRIRRLATRELRKRENTHDSSQ